MIVRTARDAMAEARRAAVIVAAGVLARALALVVAPLPGGMVRLEPSTIAANLNAGHGFVFEQYGALYRAWKEPLYMILLAWWTRWVGDGDVPLILAQSALGLLTAIGAAQIARAISGDPACATVAGVLVGINPILAYYDTHVVHYLSFVALFFVAVSGGVLFAAVGPGGAAAARTVASGVVIGLAVWLRGTLLAAGVAAWAAAVAVAERRERPRVALRAVLACLIAILVVSPWIVRNHQLLGRPVLITDFPHQVWLGNNPLSNGTFSDLHGRRVFFLTDPEFQARIQGAAELVQHDEFLRATRRFIVENPAGFAALCVQRLWAFVWFAPNAGVEYAPWQTIAGKVAYLLLLVAGTTGFVRYWRRAEAVGRRRAMVFVAGIAGIGLIHVLTVISTNHRLPLELGLAVFAAEHARGGTRWRSLRLT